MRTDAHALRNDFDGERLAFKRHGLPSAAGGGEQGEFANGKLAFGEAAEELGTDGTGGPDDGDMLEGAHGLTWRVVGNKKGAESKSSHAICN